MDTKVIYTGIERYRDTMIQVYMDIWVLGSSRKRTWFSLSVVRCLYILSAIA